MSKIENCREECPICEGEGDIGDYECPFCEGYGSLVALSVEDEECSYTTYCVDGRNKCFKHATQEVVIEAGTSFFDQPGIPPEDIFVNRLAYVRIVLETGFVIRPR